MTRMIEDAKFRAEFESFCDENGYGIVADANGVETRDTVQDFIDAHGAPEIEETRDGHRFIMIRSGRTDMLIGDAGNARLVYVGR
jgi:hypothetical protein